MASDISNNQASPTGDKVVMEDKTVVTDSEKQALEHKKVDAALEFLNAEETGSMSEVDERKLVQKIDWRIVPLMCMSHVFLPQTSCCLILLIMGLRGLL